MPPHCDTMDGPVVKAAMKALSTENVNLILPWVPKRSEAKLRRAFDKTLKARALGKKAADVADYWFFETAVRLHREGEGASYTGLKPAGLDWGPVVPKAEKAIKRGDAKGVIDFITHAVQKQLETRFKRAMEKRKYDVNDVAAAREYVKAELDFVLYSHGLYGAISGERAHGEEEAGVHEH